MMLFIGLGLEQSPVGASFALSMSRLSILIRKSRIDKLHCSY